MINIPPNYKELGLTANTYPQIPLIKHSPKSLQQNLKLDHK